MPCTEKCSRIEEGVIVVFVFHLLFTPVADFLLRLSCQSKRLSEDFSFF